MCRKNQISGFALLSFGIGVLLGKSLQSGLLCIAVSVGAIGLGYYLLRRR